jgi:endonuclease/exonuclease/phosphatase family metal-dependent hydrolase
MTHSISRRYLSAARGFFRLVVLAAFASLTIFAHHPIARADDQDGGDVRIMTQNMDQGTDFTEVLSATTPAQFFAAVTTTYQNIQATKPAERAAALAHEIAANHPDLVALQEPAILRTGTGTTPATNVISDQLALLIAALAKLGQPYETVAIIPNIDAEAPSTLGFDVRITARTVIIAKNEDVSGGLALSNVQVQEFLVNQSSPTAVGISVPDLRGWASVDVKVHGRMFRFVTTHLETTTPTPPVAAIQQAQAIELVQSAGNTTLPIVYAADFNVFADDPLDPSFATYQLLISFGLVDAWLQKGAPAAGFTCCQDPTLLNPVSELNHRIDLVLLRGNIGIQDIKLVGNVPSDRTPSGLWPSDHAGIVTTLRIPAAVH